MSIGVIGGADGPTAIFIAGSINWHTIVVVAGVGIAVVGIIIWALEKGKRKL
jgi:Na+-transporting methylmalonyl-CoA/oxaloacetate decarboxylase beta subunit